MVDNSNAAPTAEHNGEPLEWNGTSQYPVVRCIGRGGMGVVYEAFDRTRRQTIALKTLVKFTPAALYQLKQEFRALADIQHRNLVRLYELVVEDSGQVFFTMELVHGRDFRAYTRREPTGSAPPCAAEEVTLAEAVGGGLDARGGKVLVAQDARSRATELPALKKSSPVDLGRLRLALRQLVQGVHALHTAGKLHCDIKPSNVFVTDEGRVVILDFGLATEISSATTDDLAAVNAAMGTPEYMAPEQAFAGLPTPACDWYSVGVMLYEALVGSPPFTGPAIAVIDAKVTLDPPPSSELVKDVPEDLDVLCQALLARDPSQRPTGEEILRFLGGDHGSVRPSLRRSPPRSSGVHLVGRQSHIRVLRDLFETVREGHSVTVRVSGASGLGKSALAQHFVDGLAQRGEAMVLRSRVYERESIPYKAIDGVVNALSRYLKQQEEYGELITLPRNAWALACLFPVLRRVDVVADLRDESKNDPLRTRQLAFEALRELLAEMTQRQPVVLYLDDVQWGDVDSVSLLLEMIRPPEAPAVLLVMTYRDGDANTSPFLRDLLRGWPAGAQVHDLAVGPLETDDVQQLALERLGSSSEVAQGIAAAIARESGGSAFLAEELACSVSVEQLASSNQPNALQLAVTLEQMVSERLAHVDEQARRVLELVAVSGQPLSAAILAEAASVDDRLDEVLGLLRERRFVHTGMRDGREVVETSHNRIRQTIVAQLSASSVRTRHGELARALESAAQIDTEALVDHLLGAGDAERAGRFALRAAEQAAQKLAFDRAETLYRLALETIPSASPEARTARRQLAEVLEWAGRGADAGRVYLEAAKGTSGIERSELESAAAMQLLCAGRVDEGARLLLGSLASVGLRSPRSSLSALFWLLVYRVRLRLVGLRFVERDVGEVRGLDRVRVEALYTAAFGMTFIDVIAGACMQARHVLMALRRGHRFQQVRAVALEAAHCGPAGGPESERELALYQMAQSLAERSGSSEGVAFVQACRGVGLFLHGRWKQAHELLAVVYENIPQHRAGWHANAYIFNLYSLVNLGQFAKLANQLTGFLAEADQRGDLLASVAFRVGAQVVLLLAQDQPERARREVKHAMAEWSQTGFLLQHWRAMQWEVEIELYAGEGERAYERLSRDAHTLKKSLLLRVQYIRGVTDFLRARAALASLDRTSPNRQKRLSEAKRMIRRLEREAMPWTSAFASMAAAAVAIAQGEREASVVFLRAAIERAATADMLVHASAARHCLGTVLGGDEGQALVARAEEELGAQGVRAPSRFVSMLLPMALK